MIVFPERISLQSAKSMYNDTIRGAGAVSGENQTAPAQVLRRERKPRTESETGGNKIDGHPERSLNGGFFMSENRNRRIRQLALMGVLTGVMVVLGCVNIPMPFGLSITFNMIPVAIAGMAMGLGGGTIMGAVFGMISFLQCFGILGSSPMGAQLVAVAPWWMSFLQRFCTRALMGFLTALIFKSMGNRVNITIRGAVAGFSSAFLNTLLFMSALVLLFGHTEYMQKAMAGRAFLAYLVASVGVNGLVEMLTATVLTGAIGTALKKARLI